MTPLLWILPFVTLAIQPTDAANTYTDQEAAVAAWVIILIVGGAIAISASVAGGVFMMMRRRNNNGGGNTTAAPADVEIDNAPNTTRKIIRLKRLFSASSILFLADELFGNYKNN
ncbi:unnamed protein product [Caenorhabditis brenneri]